MSAPNVIVVSLLGAAGSGKSTCAEFLVKNYGFTRMALATPLKEIVRRSFELTHDQVYGDFEHKDAVDPRYNVSPRFLLQRIGTEGMREVFGKDVWIDYLCRKIFENVYGGRYVVDDLRFVNEASRLFNLCCYGPTGSGFSPGQIHSTIIKLTGVKQGTAGTTHASEAEQSQIPEEWIFETVFAEKSPNAKILLERFEQAFLNYAKTLPLEALKDFPGWRTGCFGEEEAPPARVMRESQENDS